MEIPQNGWFTVDILLQWMIWCLLTIRGRWFFPHVCRQIAMANLGHLIYIYIYIYT